ncbi:MAG: D-Ala-D-Ala carboxypeptidase family metallohydrolase, partial [Fluviibacter sp.]
METKPYSIQSPEQIAKDYSGNKQKIAEAMQMGIIDPTAGVLAGMFIDKMRSAQMQEQPQQTIAQQVMGGAPPAPQMPEAQPSGGLGAMPQAAPPMAPQDMQQMPQAAPQEAPVGMKGGGAVHGYAQYHHDSGRHGGDYTAYGADIPLDSRTHFNIDAGGRHPLNPENIRAMIRRNLGGGELSAAHTVRGQGPSMDYGYDTPFLGGQLGVHASASHGALPDSIKAMYHLNFADGGMVGPYSGGGGIGGGLSDAPVPDTMFDEPNNGGFAGGGLVAFGEGGPIGPWLEEQATKAIPGLHVTSRQRSAAHNAQVGGVKNSYHLTNNARDFTPPRGMSMKSLHAQMSKLYGPGYDIINEGDHIHVEPGSRRGKSTPRTAAPAVAPAVAPAATPAPATGLAALTTPDTQNPDTLAMQSQIAELTQQRADDIANAKRARRQEAGASLAQQGLAMLAPPELPEGFLAKGGTVHFAAGSPGTVTPPQAKISDPMDAYSPENLAKFQQSMSTLMPQSNKYADMIMEDVERRRSPEYMKSERKQVVNQTLMNFGLALMASKNPSFLGSIGEAGAPAVAQMGEEFKNLKKDAHDALVEGAQAEGMKNSAARELANLTLTHANTVATLQSNTLDRESRERMEMLQRQTQFQIEAIRQNGENYRKRLELAASSASPYDPGNDKITYRDADDNVVERQVPTKTD